MLSRVALAVATLAAAVGCADSSRAAGEIAAPPSEAAPSARPSRPAATTTSPPLPSVPPGAVVIYSATSLLTSSQKGGLSVLVERQSASDGRTTTKVTYERSEPCENEQSGSRGFVTCKVLWRKTQRLADEKQFVIDATLDSASLTDTLRGLRVTVTWQATGAPRVQVNQNGQLFSEMRDGLATTTWGTWTRTDPDDGTAPTFLVRRVPAPKG